jgi:hypothetical protein
MNVIRSMHRDPETGQFLAHDSVTFEDIEVVSFSANVGVQAADLSGATGFVGQDNAEFEGLLLVDFDDVVDRNEELRLLSAEHRATAFINSTSTEDGTVSVSAEVSASPSLTDVTGRAADASTDSFDDGPVTGRADNDDSIDLLGRPMTMTGHAPFFDSSSGAGGGGSAGEDSVDMDAAPAEFGRFHPRDELFLNGRIESWNVADAGIHLSVAGQHVFGVTEDC